MVTSQAKGEPSLVHPFLSAELIANDMETILEVGASARDYGVLEAAEKIDRVPIKFGPPA